MVCRMGVPQLDLRRLFYFGAVAEHGSLSAAARMLRIAQPALSYHIAQLEQLLGTPLLERLSNGVRLTEAGQQLLRHGTQVLEQVRLAEEALGIRSAGGEALRTVNLGLTPSLAPFLTPLLLADAKRMLPDISLRIREVRSVVSRLEVMGGELDMAVNHAPSDEISPDIIAREQLCLITLADRHKWTEVVPFRDLAGERLIMNFRGNPVRDLVDQTAQTLGVSLQVVLEIDGLETRRQAIVSGLGSTIGTVESYRRQLEGDHLAAYPLASPELSKDIVLQVRPGFGRGVHGTLRRMLIEAFRTDSRRRKLVHRQIADTV